MIEIKEINFSSSESEKKSFIKAYIKIFNEPENLKYLSFTGIPFRQEMVKDWVDGLGQNSEIRYRIA